MVMVRGEKVLPVQNMIPLRCGNGILREVPGHARRVKKDGSEAVSTTQALNRAWLHESRWQPMRIQNM